MSEYELCPLFLETCTRNCAWFMWDEQECAVKMIAKSFVDDSNE